MSEIDYKKLNFKSGLEIHQQLNTGKLFCRCPSVLRKGEPDFEIERKLHAVAGESGDVDIAVSHEIGKDKKFIYQGYDTTCLVELDEEPPHKINFEALKIAVQIALLMKMKIVPITQIMRKVVVDGSNTSGFQRTLLVARDGFVETSSGKVRIDYLYLEEDAARIVRKEKEKIIYKLDRLGIPLVEIVTAPDVKTSEQAKEVALKIGEILRSCNVIRGIGTIRQDVNVSIYDGNRVEIKGMQDMRIFIKVIENEIERQRNLYENKKPVDMEVRNAMPDGSTKFMRPLPGSARMYPETDLPLLKISKQFIDDVKRTLPKLRGNIESELKKRGLNQEFISLIFKKNKLEDFRDLMVISDNANLAAKMLLIYPNEIAFHNKLEIDYVEEKLNNDALIFVLEKLKEGKISESQIKNILERIVLGEGVQDAIKIKKADIGLIEEEIFKLVKSKPGLSKKAYMGLIMKEFRGKVDGKEIMSIIDKNIQ
jgi:Glu-tRNA(Gln) amidotransferase subunit E-like FAD-binding protein